MKVWKVYTGFQAIYTHSDCAFFRQVLAYFSRTMWNHILDRLQQHNFKVEESEAGIMGRGWHVCSHQLKSFITSWNEKYAKRRPQTVEQLESYFREEWDNIPLWNVQKQLSCVSRHLHIVVEKGNITWFHYRFLWYILRPSNRKCVSI